MRSLLALCLLCFLTACASKPGHPDEATVREFLTRYFSTWSAKDMDGYGACFHPQARVTFVNKNGSADGIGLTDFLHGQKMSHQMAEKPMKEVPLDMQISGDARVTQAAVKWHLTKADGDETGMDYFTLVYAEGKWSILSLAFFIDPKEEEEKK
jgi:hypothetical protein